jgi:[ribosomal protein S18]-alanine N-acetyltransferase
MVAPAVSAFPPRVVRATSREREAAEEVVHATGATVDVEAELARPIAHLWLAFLPGEPRAAGLLLAWIAADELHVIDVATRPDRRRRGVARSLVATALATGIERGLRLALLEVRVTNRPAIALYESAGFTADRNRRGYYADGEDALEMSLELAALARRPQPHP